MGHEVASFMAESDESTSTQRDGSPRKGRPDPSGRALSRGDVVRLILASYRATLPVFLVVLLGLVLATWLFTTVLFR